MVLEGLLTAVGGFTGRRVTASMEVLKDGVWLDDGSLPMPRSALTCAVLPQGMDLEDSEESDTSEEEEEEEMGGDSLISTLLHYII